jgi:hypothetical protein
MSGKDHKEERSKQISQSQNSSASQTTATSSSSFSAAATSSLIQPTEYLSRIQNNYDAQEHTARMAGLDVPSVRQHLVRLIRQEGHSAFSGYGFFPLQAEGSDGNPFQPLVGDGHHPHPQMQILQFQNAINKEDELRSAIEKDMRIEMLRAEIRRNNVNNIRNILVSATKNVFSHADSKQTKEEKIEKEANDLFNAACQKSGLRHADIRRLHWKVGYPLMHRPTTLGQPLVINKNSSPKTSILAKAAPDDPHLEHNHQSYYRPPQ